MAVAVPSVCVLLCVCLFVFGFSQKTKGSGARLVCALTTGDEEKTQVFVYTKALIE